MGEKVRHNYNGGRKMMKQVFGVVLVTIIVGVVMFYVQGQARYAATDQRISNEVPKTSLRIPQRILTVYYPQSGKTEISNIVAGDIDISPEGNKITITNEGRKKTTIIVGGGTAILEEDI
jgi:uncharacterized protein Veg